ncbi:MAG: beta-ketoacyl synthase N-terminal-like domain-containing protein [Planctomycetota bacterium]
MVSDGVRQGVVITGVGAATGFGLGAEALWSGLASGESAIGPITRFDASVLDARLGAEATGFSVRNVVPKGYRKATKVMARDIELAVAAAADAVSSAGFVTKASDSDETTYPPGRLGCCIGAGLIAAEMPELAGAAASSAGDDGGFSLKAWGEVGMGNLQPLWMLKYLPNMLACHVTIVHGAEGPSNTITCAEASGLLSIGESARIIERGDADACFSGSAESKINHTGMVRMGTTGRLAACGEGDDPRDVLLPYDEASRGTVMGEGGGICMLESEATAAARGARIVAQVLGFGAAQSPPGRCGLDLGWGASEPGPDTGLVSAIRRALADASVTPGEIDVIIPRASGVPSEDRPERLALETVFGADLGGSELLTWTPALGDCVAGNGGLQAVIGAMCIEKGTVPACERSGVRRVLLCSGSLGGQNAAIVLGNPGGSPADRASD